MAKQLDKVYDPKQVEDRIYQNWLDSGYFHAVPDSQKKPYTIVIPPPNITGQLHMGHAMDNTMQDALIRWRRMQGFCTLWLPGTDHASIATEAKIVEAMKAEGVTKQDIGREAFLERAWRWKEQYGGRIIEQLKKMGSSCDWQRERFTLDEGCSKAVKEVFVRLYEKGYIYRGERIINWCPHCHTSISDAEVEYEEKEGNFYHLRYPLSDGSGFLELATTRPETMLGDTAVAVHPEDERYRHLVGKTVILPLVNKEIPIIADEYVEMDFGTGVVKITPAHDPNDFEVGLRHDLPVVNVMTDDAVINDEGGVYAGLDRYEARKRIVHDLEQKGLLVKIEPHHHNVGSCYRCSTVVEPRVSLQWFVKMQPLAEPAIEAVKNKETVFVPERFEKIYFHWMENIKDWCISRQLWWGHRIPAFYCRDCGELIVTREDSVTSCPRCGSKKVEQDPDTLDTWFSSALWPFSTLGWPEETEDLKYFYPTNTLVTGYDIIFFWVARMIFSGVEQMGRSPFDTVLIHGIIRDALGRKMSKSLGNGIDPLDLIEEFGADALRFTLVTGNTPGNDMRFSDEKVKASRNFANKIWNAARFVLMNLKEGEDYLGLPEDLGFEDKWVIGKYNTLVKEVNDNLEKFELGLASSKLYAFLWDVFCDWYIELAKARLSDPQEANGAARVLVYILSGTMKLLHPFMPFITEEIWQALPHIGPSIMVSEFPAYDSKLNYAAEESDFQKIVDFISAVRNTRTQMQVPPSKKAQIKIETQWEELFRSGIPFIQRLGSSDHVMVERSQTAQDAVRVITDCAIGYIPLEDLIDKSKEIERLMKEKTAAEKECALIASKLENESFVSRAPQHVVEAEREKLGKAKERLSKIEQSLKELGV